MPRQYFISICPSCRCANQIDLRKMGRQIACVRCNQEFSCQSVDSQSAALDSPMGFWARYTAVLDCDQESNQQPRDISRIPK